MPRRIVIHAGFHKTGSSSVQYCLRQNRPALRPYLRSILRPGLKPVVSAARGYSTWRDPVTLAKFRHRFEAVLRDVTGMPKRVLVLSAEELSGHLPGRDGLHDYSAAVSLATEMQGAVAHVMPGVPVTFCYMTRAPEPWLQSAYWEHVKSSSLTLDFEAFADRFPKAHQLEEIVAGIRRAVTTEVVSQPLDALADLPAGPASAVLDSCDVPAEVQAGLVQEVANVRADRHTLLQLLEINRTEPDPDKRRAAKAALLAQTTEAANV